MTHQEKAAIIGYHRSGASVETIAGIMRTEIFKIEMIINFYLKNGHHK